MKDYIVVICCLFAAALLLTSAGDCAAGAEDVPLEVQLARYAVHEAGFDAPGDAVAIWEVARYRASHVPGVARRCDGDLACALRLYAAERPFREAWIGQLGMGKPSAWPTNVSWERYASRRWTRLVDLARRWLAGEMPPPCRFYPMHWGSRTIAIDVARGERALSDGRWRRAACVDPIRRQPTRNAFYCNAPLCREVRAATIDS